MFAGVLEADLNTPPGSDKGGKKDETHFYSLPGLCENDVTEAFNNIDDNFNGFLDAGEIRGILERCGLEDESDEVIDEMIRMADSEGIGQVSLEGYINLMQTPAMVAEMRTHDVATRGKKLKSAKERRQMRKTRIDAGEETFSFKQDASEVADREEADAQARLETALNFIQKASETRVKTISESQPKLFKSRGRARQNALSKDKEQGVLKPAILRKLMLTFNEIDEDKSGEIDYLEFCKALKKEPSPSTEQLFAMFDTDNSGAIELREFIVGLSSYVNLSTVERAKFAFLMTDKDGSGFVDREELIMILKANFINKGGSTEAIEQRADRLLKSVGLPPDGQLDMETFRRVAAQTPGLLFPAEVLCDKLDLLSKKAFQV